MENSLYKLSVIVPHYTKSGTSLLERAVKSIPDDSDIQVLVIDNSPEPINSYIFESRKNVEVLFSDNTKGAGHARNVGIENSKGKWMLFLDADDFFMDGAFGIIKKYYDDIYDIIFFKMTSCFSDTLKEATRHKAYKKIIDDYFVDKNEYPLRCNYPSPCGKMVSSKMVKENNILYDEVPASNDVMFGLKIGLIAKRIFVDKNIIYCATVEKGSLTNTVSLKNIESRFNVKLRKNKMLKEHGYKKTESVMYFIVSSLKFGLKPFIKLFFKALITGNLFVGYKRWFKTSINKKYNGIKDYKVKE